MNFKKKLRNEYVFCFDYLKKSRKFIYYSVLIFFVFALLGFFVKVPDQAMSMLLEYFRALLEKTSDYSTFQMSGFIFLNNLQATFFSILLGVLLGIFPLFNSVLNGFVLGVAAKLSVASNGFFSLWRLLPHGIFELPAVFISLGLGMKFGTFIFKKDSKRYFMSFLTSSLRVYLFVVLPLLLLAAFIEGVLIVSGI